MRIKYLTGWSQGYLAAEESVSDPHSGYCESFPKRDAGPGAARVSEGKTFTLKNFHVTSFCYLPFLALLRIDF